MALSQDEHKDRPMSDQDLKDQIRTIQKNFKEDIRSLDLDSLHIKYLGKKGHINSALSALKDLTKEAKIEIAKEINQLKNTIESDLANLRNENKHAENKQSVDLTIPVQPTKMGNLHPTTQVLRDLYDFFHYYGFSVYDGPDIEDDFHNFEMLGVPADHPARELQDTLYLMEPEVMLRTQTSSVEARQLKEQQPPIRFVFGGRAFRNETNSSTNSSFFHQFQGVCVDKDIHLGHLKWMFTKALKHVLGEQTEIRFRAKYYPEVEPGLSPDIKCTFCNGEGCEVCKYRGWTEIAGGGMIHPSTLEKAGIDPKEYSGFAFGWGLDRIAKERYGIKDIRVLFNGSIVYR